MPLSHSYFNSIIVSSGVGLGSTQYPGSSTPIDDEPYLDWLREMKRYAEDTNSVGARPVFFWLIFRLPKENFADQIEMHEYIPMMMPKPGCGYLLAIASSKEETEEIISEDIEQWVYLTYKCRVQGQHAWRSLLDFMGKHNMLDRDQ